MKINFLDLYSQDKYLLNKINKSIVNNIRSSSFIGGNDLNNFEKNFSKYLNIKYSLGVANGTDALEIAIKSLALKPKSEIIVPANTWISTAEAVVNCGHIVKFCDIDNSHNICVKSLKKNISKKTKAIIVVHLYGNPSDMNSILKLKDKYKFKLIEDCAQAHGAEYNNKKVSTFGDIGTFSFFPSKNLGCFGDGGCIVTNTKKYFITAKKIANHGGLKKNSHLVLGRNSRLDNIQAGILNVKLNHLDKSISKRNYQAKLYFQYLDNMKDIDLIKPIKNTFSSYHLFVVRSNKRNQLRKFLIKKGIQTSIHYPKSLPQVTLFKKKHYNKCKKFKSISYSKKIISLPLGNHLNKKKIIYICNSIKEFFNV